MKAKGDYGLDETKVSRQTEILPTAPAAQSSASEQGGGLGEHALPAGPGHQPPLDIAQCPFQGRPTLETPACSWTPPTQSRLLPS